MWSLLFDTEDLSSSEERRQCPYELLHQSFYSILPSNQLAQPNDFVNTPSVTVTGL